MRDILLKLACHLVLVSLRVIYNLEGKKEMPSKREKKKNLKTYQRERLHDLLTRTVYKINGHNENIKIKP